MTPGASYGEWLEMVREEDERNRAAFMGERPLTVTEFVHRKRAMEAEEQQTGSNPLVYMQSAIREPLV